LLDAGTKPVEERLIELGEINLVSRPMRCPDLSAAREKG
jgi:hypothetical protein